MNSKRVAMKWGGAIVAAAMALGACGGDDSTAAKTQAELCAEICKQAETECVKVLDGASVDDCSSTCAAQTDTSLEFLQCSLDATDCDGYSACKKKF